VRLAADVDDYRAELVGSYLVGKHSLVFCARSDLWGFALWGRPTADDVRWLIPLLAIELGPPAEPHGSLVDARHLEDGPPAAFGLLAKYVADHFAALQRQVRRLAIVRPAGVAGAVVAGFFAVQDPPYPVEVFADIDKATAWLGAGTTLPAELDDAIAAATGVTPLIGQLRAWIEARLADDAALQDAARSLSLSPRSLQRKLADAGTTFQGELDAARIRVAQRLLLAGDISLTEVAYDVGCASPQHFSALFRRVVGEPPSTWRSSRQRGREPR
jgi:AraC-like DNA-binding protein